MKQMLVIDGNAVYEIDEECLARKAGGAAKGKEKPGEEQKEEKQK